MAILLLMGVSPTMSLCQGVIGHNLRNVFKMVVIFSELVSILRWLEFVGAGEGGGEGLESMTCPIAPLILGSRYIEAQLLIASIQA